MANMTVQLPNGHDFLLRVDVTDGEATGLLVLVITSAVSALAVLVLLGVIATSAWNTRKSVNPHMFVRSHAAAYLISLLICDLCQAFGSLMNAKWYMDHAVVFQPFCVAQGAIKQLSDVGIAIWSLTIAMHTFWVLFLRWDLRRYVMIAVLASHWAAVGTLVIAGPAALNVRMDGPFFGISGYWCWITDQYPASRITLDYMFMLVSAMLSTILYTLVYLRLRGNILPNGWRLRVRIHRKSDSMNGIAADSQARTVARQMLLYPVAYTILILPIAVCRFAEWSGHDVPFSVTIFSDSVYLLSGLVNVLLFFLTRRVLPRHSVVTRKFRPDTPTIDLMEDETRRPSFMVERMEDDRDSFIIEHEKMSKQVEGFDADQYYSEVSLPADAYAASAFVPVLQPVHPLRLPASKASSRAATPTGSYVTTDESMYSSQTHMEYPANALGPLITREYLSGLDAPRSASLRPIFRDSTGRFSPIPPSR